MTHELTKNNFVPIQGMVLIQKSRVEEKTSSGIILNQEGTEHPSVGIIIAKNPADYTFKYGDTVLFSKYSGNEIVLQGETLTVLKIADILGSFNA